MFKYFFAVVLVLAFLSGSSLAQSDTHHYVRLVVDCTCSDTVAKSYARSLRDEIAKSPRYEEVVDSQTNQKKAIRLDIISLPVDDDQAGQSQQAAISVVFRVNSIYLSQYLQICGVQASDKCAKRVLDNVDDLVQKLAALDK